MTLFTSNSGISRKKLLSAIIDERSSRQVPQLLADVARMSVPQVFERLSTSTGGLTTGESVVRRDRYGPNILGTDQQHQFWKLLSHAVLNPVVLLLGTLASVSLATGDFGAASIMFLMIGFGVGLKLIQESRADRAAAKLKAMISVTATVLRDGKCQEIALSQLVPGDIIELAAGDMVPADVRIVSAKELFVTQSTLTGESFPVEKFEVEKNATGTTPIDLTSVAFLGTSIQSGAARAAVVLTGKETLLGGIAHSLSGQEPAQTAFDKGITRFTWLMLRFILIMVPLVFVINGLSKGKWVEAFFFAVAVAVGLTPEMLPMIVTVCLSKGALAMSRKNVIVKRMNAIQNLGAMDVLCTDKTGTLTMDRVILEKHCDVALKEDDGVLALAYMNSHFQTGLRNVLDRAILSHTETHVHSIIPDFAKVDEIPFDFQRRIMSVVVRTPEGMDRIISKGAPEAIFPCCKNFELNGQLYSMDHEHIDTLQKEYERLSSDGFRVLALASKDVSPPSGIGPGAFAYSKADEHDLILNGYVAFLDPPKETALAAISNLQKLGIAVKVITGDNDKVARKICKEVGLPTEHVLLGSDLDLLSDAQLADVTESVTLFARVSPTHKQRVIQALQSRGHIVGFIGDGINDAPALHTSDVGISVDTAVDVAKESADLILLEKSLLVLEAGVIEGRKVFANILKYVRPVSTDGADPDSREQLALRPQPGSYSNRQCGRRASREAATMEYQISDPFHSVHWPVLICLRLFHISHHVVCVQLLEHIHTRGRSSECQPVSNRLVYREPVDSDIDHSRHPHKQNSIPAKPFVMAVSGRLCLHRGGGYCDSLYASREQSRLYRSSGSLLADTDRDAAVLRAPDPMRQDMAGQAELDLSGN
jgi:Mg2+-importing ATPase